MGVSNQKYSHTLKVMTNYPHQNQIIILKSTW